MWHQGEFLGQHGQMTCDACSFESEEEDCVADIKARALAKEEFHLHVADLIVAAVREQIAREIEAERDRFVARFPDDPTGYESSICNRCASIARGEEA